jgi:hypothetical protein
MPPRDVIPVTSNLKRPRLRFKEEEWEGRKEGGAAYHA